VQRLEAAPAGCQVRLRRPTRCRWSPATGSRSYGLPSPPART